MVAMCSHLIGESPARSTMGMMSRARRLKKRWSSNHSLQWLRVLPAIRLTSFGRNFFATM